YSSKPPPRVAPSLASSNLALSQPSLGRFAASLRRPTLQPATLSLSVRHASTTLPQPSGLGAEAMAEPGAPPVDEFLSDATQIIDAIRKSELQPHIGYMKELGLDFGWGPTAFLQWSLEHVVVHLETPWWASLAITTLAIRLVLFGLHIGASDNAARLEAVKPHLKDIRKRLDEAKETRNMRDMLQYTAEMKQVYAVAGVKMWKNLLPFMQFPLAFGIFRLTRNMAWLPVPGNRDLLHVQSVKGDRCSLYLAKLGFADLSIYLASHVDALLVVLASCVATRFRLDFDLGLDSKLSIHTALVPEVPKDSPNAPSSVACISASHGDNDDPDNRSLSRTATKFGGYHGSSSLLAVAGKLRYHGNTRPPTGGKRIRNLDDRKPETSSVWKEPGQNYMIDAPNRYGEDEPFPSREPSERSTTWKISRHEGNEGPAAEMRESLCIMTRYGTKCNHGLPSVL
ncbi:MAG: hypothetical protein Q9193_003655, partial [Seirophora villosa]